MKKTFKIFCILFIMICIIGCKKKEEVKEEPLLAEDEVILENIKYKFDQDSSEYGINFKLSSNLRRVDNGNTISYFSEKINDRSYFVFRLFHYKNKDIDYAIKDSTSQYDNKYEKEIGDKKYTVVHFKNPIGDNVETNIYYYKNKNDVYAFCFTSSIDLSRLEEVFLKSIVYN